MPYEIVLTVVGEWLNDKDKARVVRGMEIIGRLGVDNSSSRRKRSTLACDSDMV